jgi:hypothetical protein
MTSFPDVQALDDIILYEEMMSRMRVKHLQTVGEKSDGYPRALSFALTAYALECLASAEDFYGPAD